MELIGENNGVNSVEPQNEQGNTVEQHPLPALIYCLNFGAELNG